MIEKPMLYKSKAYREFIKKQPCCITGRMEVDPHHTKSVGSGGSDLTLIPLIHELHQECHTIGAGTFQKKYSIDFDLIQLALIKKWVEGGM